MCIVLKENPQMKIDRDILLKQLEVMLPGLSTKEEIEQSSCFIFDGSRVYTYNDEIACQQPSCLKIKGAVPAMPLINILRRLKEKTLVINLIKGTLHIKGKRKEVGLTVEKKIILPTETLEPPGKWSTLPENFSDALSIVQECASSNKSIFLLGCIYWHPEYLIATDNYQISKYNIKTKISKPTLVRKDSLKHLITLGITKFSETDNWLHFKNPNGLILSCQRYLEEYPDMKKALKVEGTSISLPKGLKEAAEKASIFSSENTDENQIAVSIKQTKLRITGNGPSGWYRETKKVSYKGQPMSFTISPKLLIHLTQKYNDCMLSGEKLKVNGENFSYVTTLGVKGKSKSKKSE